MLSISLILLAVLAQDPEASYTFYSTVFGTTVTKPGGLTGLVYAIPVNTNHLPAFENLRPISKIYTNKLDIPLQDFDRGFPGVPDRFEWFAIDYTGNIWITKAGRYHFELESDDGSALFLDNQLVIENDGIHPAIAKQGSIKLTAGLHRIRIAYFQGPRLQIALRLKVASPGHRLHILNTDDFVPR